MKNVDQAHCIHNMDYADLHSSHGFHTLAADMTTPSFHPGGAKKKSNSLTQADSPFRTDSETTSGARRLHEACVGVILASAGLLGLSLCPLPVLCVAAHVGYLDYSSVALSNGCVID